MRLRPSGLVVFRVALVLAVTVMWTSPASSQLPPARTIVLTGSSPPDQPPGVSFADVEASMDPSGRIAIVGTLAGSGITPDNDRGVWMAGHDSVIAHVIQEGEAAPDLPGLTFLGITGAVYPSLRGAAYKGFLAGPGVTIYNNLASFSNRTLVHRFEEQAPGFDPDVTWDGAVTDVNGGGDLLLFGPLHGPGIDATNDDALYRWSGGSFTQLLRLGDPADGGGTFADITLAFGFNRDGNVSFRGAVEDPPGVFTTSLWVGGDGGWQLAARAGQIIATVSGSGTLDLLQTAPVLSEVGQFMAFTGHLSSGQKGLWVLNGPVVWRPVALEGEQIGGFTVMDVGAPVIAEDSVAFLATLAVVGEGIVLDTAAGQTLIAKGGDAPPGAPAGTEFDSFSDPAINSLGQVVFEAQFSGTASGEGLWLWTSDGELRPVAITGQPLWISPSDLRTPTALGFAGGASYNPGQGGSVSLTDDGLILFAAIFADGVRAVVTSDPENIGIWATGFETGDLSSWSSSVP